MSNPAVKPHPQGTLLLVHAVPRAKCSAVDGLHGTSLKVRIASPPVDGAANTELCRFLAKALKVSKRMVRLVRGETGREKQLVIEGLSPEELCRRLELGKD